MIIYEVNLTVEQSVAKEFAAWLPPHIETILKFDGFISASWFERRHQDEGKADNSSEVLWTVQYRLKDRASLENYLEKHAPAMREDGKRRFGGRFSAQRRVLTQLQEF